MYMSINEILYKVRQQKGRFSYIPILADLNCCTESDIEKILLDAGWKRGVSGWEWPQPKPLVPTYNTSKRLKSNSSLNWSASETIKEKKHTIVVKKQVGCEMGKTKYTEELKQEMADYYFSHPTCTYKALAEKFGCSDFMAGDIVRKYANGRKRESVSLEQS